MTSSSTIQALDELLRMLCRSLPAYLIDAKPWASSGDQHLRVALGHLAADQQRYVHRIEHAIIELGSRPDCGHFPKAFAAKNDLSLDYLHREVIQQLEQDIVAIKDCVAQLDETAALHSLAEEILGNAKAHLEILKETLNAER
jgi:hypothetical protein